MSKVQEALRTEEEKRAINLSAQRMVLCPEGEFVFIHKECLDETMLLFHKSDLIVFPGQIEEFSTGQVLIENKIESVGICDCCRNEINESSSFYYRLWVLTKSDYERNVEYRKSYGAKKEKLRKRQAWHMKWQEREHRVPLFLRPLVRLARKLAYRFGK